MSGSKTTSSGGTQSTAQSNQNQQSWVPNESVSDLYGFLAGNTQQLMQQAVPYFPGQGYVGPSEYTQQGLETGQQAVANMQPLLNQATQNYGYLSNAADVANNPYVQGMIKQNEVSASDWLKNQAMPELQAGAVGVNNLGSSRLGLAQGQAMGEAQKNLLAQNAATQMGAYQQGLSAQQNALGQTNAMLGNYLLPAQSLGQMGQTVEGYQQRALDDAMSRYQYQYNEPWKRMQNVAQTLQALQGLGTQYSSSAGYGNQANTNTQANASYKSPWQTAAGLALLAASAYTGGATAPAGAAMLASS